MTIEEVEKVGTRVHWRGEAGRVAWVQPVVEDLRGLPEQMLQAMQEAVDAFESPANVGRPYRLVEGIVSLDIRRRRVLVMLDRPDSRGIRFVLVTPNALWRDPCDGPVGYQQIHGMLVRGEDGKVGWRCETCGATGRAARPKQGGKVRHERPGPTR